MGEYLFKRGEGELMYSKSQIRIAILGGNGKGGHVLTTEEKRAAEEKHASSADAHAPLKRQASTLADTDCHKTNCCILAGLLQDLGHTEELNGMMDTIMQPVEEGGCRQTAITEKVNGQLFNIDFDLVVGVLLLCYERILTEERDALKAIAQREDFDDDGEIHLDEFKSFVKTIMPDHHTERQLVKLFNHMCTVFGGDGDSGDGDDDDEHTHITYEELSLYCVSHGLYVSPAWKKIADDFVL
jgi:hypothetical protein